MRFFITLVVFFACYSSLLIAQERILHFSPLPIKSQKKTIEEFLPLVDYLQTNKLLNIEFSYHKDYKDILQSFIDGNVDLAYLGPLPYSILKSQYPHIEPLISFDESYRCVISKFSADTIDLSKPVSVALTQPLSTCGYFFTKKLLKKRFDLDLKNQKYDYTMSHTNALIGVMRKDFLLAGSSEAIAKKFESLGMEILERSEKLPPFAIVINTKTLSPSEIDAIRKVFLNIPKKDYENLGGIFTNGAKPADINSYTNIQLIDTIPKEGNLK